MHDFSDRHVIEKTTYIIYESSMTNRLIIEMFRSCIRPLPLPLPLSTENFALASDVGKMEERKKKKKEKKKKKSYRDK